MSPQNYLPTNLDDNSVEEILVKLPVKSLMRFKCVSKTWQSLIQDPSFVKSHSHHSRSKTHPQLLISIDSTYNDGASKIFYSPENEFEGGLAVPKVTISPWSRQAVMLKPIDGLFCCVDDIYGVTCIYNLGTRQVTPWAQSSIPLQGGHSLTGMPIYGFGFDPSTDNYKVLRVWEITRHWHGYAMESVYHICEVFTVGGENQWRKIDEVPPVRLYERPAGVYANGSIYWRKAPAKGFGLRPQDDKMLVAFDVGSEKFRVIRTPDFNLEFPGTSKYYLPILLSRKLLQIDGHIGLMDRVDFQVVKLWIYDDDCNKEKKEKMTTNWTEETIWLPHTLLQGLHPLDFNPVEGTDEIIIKSHIPNTEGVPRGFVSLHIYNRTMKSFREIHITGIAPLLAWPYDYQLYIFHESLVSIQKPAAEEEKLTQVTSLV